MKRILVIIVVVAALAAVASPKVLPLLRGSDASMAKGNKATLPKPKNTVSALTDRLRVSAVLVRPTTLMETVAATGTLRADESVELQPEINGKVVAINFTEGARVARGDLLLKLNDADLQATLKRAIFRRELAEIRERRLAKLLETKSVNQQDYDVALSEVSVQRAEIALVESQIAKTEIRAPFDGVIGLRFVSEGAFVTPTIRVATLQRLDQLKIDFSIPEKYAARVRVGSPLTFSVAGGDHKYHGEIYALDPRIDVTTRTVLIRARAGNVDGGLFPGAFANVEFTLAQIDDALLVPAVSVVPGVSEKNVFVVRDGKAERRPVQTGMRTESSVHILAGLVSGDMVITSGLQQLRAGLAVNPLVGDEKSATGLSQ